MGEDFDNHRRIFDGGPSTRLRTGDDLQGAAAVGAVFDVDVEDPFEQPGPTQERCFSLGTGVISRGLGGTLCRSRNDFTAPLRVGCWHAMVIYSATARGRPGVAVRCQRASKSSAVRFRFSENT